MADEKTPAKPTTKSTPEAEPVREPLEILYLEHPHTLFDLSGLELEPLVPEGTAYSPKDADRVRMMCLKYKVRYREGE
jgi:hypothetical protein